MSTEAITKQPLESKGRKQLLSKHLASLSNLYSTKENPDGSFEAILPGGFNGEHTTGAYRAQFPDKVTMEGAVALAKETSTKLTEKFSLEKSFIGQLYNITETEEGNFKVTLPGLYNSKTGYYMGTSSKEFSSWAEARVFYLHQLESSAQLTQHPIVEIKTSPTEQLSFSNFNNFNPKVAPTDKPHIIPASIAEYILRHERMAGEDRSAVTYQKTIEEHNWEKSLFSFIKNYLQTDTSTKLVSNLNITDLALLTPRQAIELTSQLILGLVKYTKNKKPKREAGDLSASEKTAPDKSTTLGLLQEGLANRKNPDWKGNGVCRNFASMTKAVFEALKANQTTFNYLRNTYCLYDSSMEESSPKRKTRKDRTGADRGRIGHAWNTFVTISEDSANATIIDTTWAKRNLDTGEVENLDHTLTRMEPIIHQVAMNLSSDAPDRENQLNHIFSYYQLKMGGLNDQIPKIVSSDKLTSDQKTHYQILALDKFGEDYDLTDASKDELMLIGQRFEAGLIQTVTQEVENKFFSYRVIKIIQKQKNFSEIPQGLLRVLGREYKEIADDIDHSEIETLWQINIHNKKFPFPFDDILKAYLENNQFIQQLIFKDNALQKIVFEQMLQLQQSDFHKYIKSHLNLRVRLREVLPERLMVFSPLINNIDKKELIYLVNRSTHIPSKHSVNKQDLTQENLTVFFTKARKKLQELNPSLYAQIAEPLTDYELIKEYSQLYVHLRRKINT